MQNLLNHTCGILLAFLVPGCLFLIGVLYRAYRSGKKLRARLGKEAIALDEFETEISK